MGFCVWKGTTFQGGVYMGGEQAYDIIIDVWEDQV